MWTINYQVHEGLGVLDGTVDQGDWIRLNEVASFQRSLEKFFLLKERPILSPVEAQLTFYSYILFWQHSNETLVISGCDNLTYLS